MAQPGPVTAVSAEALAKLADVVTPPPIAFVPRTWGWAGLAILVIALFGWWAWRRYRWRLANCYRVEALDRLAVLERATADSSDRSAALIAMAELLKRTALAAFPRPEVASLSGDPWVRFLEAHAPDRLPPGPRRFFAEVTYEDGALAALSPSDAQEIAAATRRWIGRHRVPA